MSRPPTNITISTPTSETLPSLTRLTRTLLPINYPEKFFTDQLLPPSTQNTFSLAKIAIWHDPSGSQSNNNNINNAKGQVVGAICGRILPPSPPPSLSHGSAEQAECQLYLATLAVLAPWRGQGIAAALLTELVSSALDFTSASSSSTSTAQTQLAAMEFSATQTPDLPPIHLGRLTSVSAHVWETNDVGLEWYRRQGFEVGDVIKGYYRKLRPDGARLVRRGILGLVLDGAGASEFHAQP